jgi:hypothetical protein
MTASLVILVLVGLTSLAACVVGLRRRGPAARGLGWAVSRTVECAGLALVFLLANLVLGVGLILGFRALTGRFVSVYILRDDTLVLFSILQGVVTRWWWADRPGADGGATSRTRSSSER